MNIVKQGSANYELTIPGAAVQAPLSFTSLQDLFTAAYHWMVLNFTPGPQGPMVIPVTFNDSTQPGSPQVAAGVFTLGLAKTPHGANVFEYPPLPQTF